MKNQNNGCGNCGGCLPPDDDMKRKKEKTDNRPEWTCCICGHPKTQGNQIFSFGQASSFQVCNECADRIYQLREKGELEETRPDRVCSFCHSGQKDGVFVGLVQSLDFNELYICDKCIEAMEDIRQLSLGERRRRMIDSLSVPSEIYESLCQFVVGQDTAKKVLATSFYLSELILKLNKMRSSTEERMQRSNLLLVGPTGCGKTLLMETIQKISGKVVVIADATSFSEAGYIGGDVEDIFTRLLIQAGGNLEKAQEGVVFIDEIDKIAEDGEGRSDVSRGAVQQALLTALQGGKIMVSPSFSRKADEKKVEFDTSQIFFVVAGAFSGLVKLVRERIKSGELGFFAKTKTAFNSEEIMKMVSREDLVSFGLFPEFLGRFHRLVIMDHLTLEDYVRIITEPRDSLLWHWKKIFLALGKDFSIDDDALQEIAKRAFESVSGARGLRGLLEEVMSETVFNFGNTDDQVIGFRLTKEVLEKGGTLQPVYKEDLLEKNSIDEDEKEAQG